MMEGGMVSGFSRLQMSGLRRLTAVNLDPRPLNVLIGANGVGKSLILECWAFYRMRRMASWTTA